MKRLAVLLLLSIAPIFAGEQQDVEDVLHKYQALLGLSEWNIHVHMATVDQLTKIAKGKDVMAISKRSRDGVEIWVMLRSEYTPKIIEEVGGDPKDPEFPAKDQRNSVVHELVHQVWELAKEEDGVMFITNAINP